MKKIYLILLTLIFTYSFNLGDSIGFIDMQKITQGYKEVIKFDEELNKKAKKLEDLYVKSQEKIEKARKNGENEEELKKLIIKESEKLEPQKEELLNLKAAFTNRLIGEITTTSKLIAKDYGVDIVIDKSAIIYGGFDLTEFVLNKLNE